MKFEEGKIYLTEDTALLNKLQDVRDKLNAMGSLSWDERRDMANLLFLLEQSFEEYK